MDLIVNVLLSFILTVVVHESGHYFFGRMSGYSFRSLELFGVKMIRKYGQLKIMLSQEACIGQCIMLPAGRKIDGSLLILGGVFFNAYMACISGVLTGIFPKFCFPLFFLNLAAVLGNLYPFSATNDGNTYSDAIKSALHMETYNRLMEVYSAIVTGEEWKNLDDELFEMPDIVFSSLSAEFAVCRLLHVTEKADFDDTGKKAVNRELRRLERFAPGLVDMEAMDGIGFYWKNN